MKLDTLKPDVFLKLAFARPRSLCHLLLFFLLTGSMDCLASEKLASNPNQVAESSSRPLSIRGAGSGIVEATLSGPQFHASHVFQGAEDFYNPRIKKMREDYDFLKSIEGETHEFAKILKLRHWIHSQWPVDNSSNFSGDAFAILEEAKTGAGFHCAHSMVVQHAVMSATGLVARDLGVDVNHEEFGRSRHHGVNEVWSNDFAKWVLLDAKYDVHYERDGVPMSALELHEAVRADNTDDIIKVKGVERKPTPMIDLEAAEARYHSYWWVGYHLGQSRLTQPHLDDGSRLVIFDNPAFRETTWYRGNGDRLAKHWAYRADAFIPTSDRHEIEWTPGVPDIRARQTAPGKLSVRLSSSTPNLKAYLASTDGGPWESLARRKLDWELAEGANELRIRTINLFDVEGPVVTARVTFRP